MSKKILSIVLALVLLVGVIPAAAIPASAAGVTGTYADGVLTFTGTGSAPTSTELNSAPWKANMKDVATVVFPKGLTAIPAGVFTKTNFPNLANVHVESLNAWCGVTFDGDNPLEIAHNLWQLVPKKAPVQIKSPKIENVSAISANAFKGANFQAVSIGGHVASIGANAFDGSSLTAVTIGGNVTNIESGVFANCPNLQQVKVAGKVSTMGTGVFQNSQKLAAADLASSKLTSLPENTFNSCAALKTVNLPAKLQTIESNAFKNCYALTGFTMPAELTTVKANAFDGCNRLSSVVANAKLQTIEADAFANCTGLTGVYVPSIGSWCNVSMAAGSNPLAQAHKLYVKSGSSWKEVKDLTIPSSVSSLNDYVFEGCTSLQVVRMGTTLGTIGDNTFKDTNLKEVHFGDVAQRDRLMAKFPGTPKFFPEGEPAANSCGTDLTWEIKGDTLVISGTGNTISSATWKDAAHDAARAKVTKIVFPGNITNIADTAAFEAAVFPALKDIEPQNLATYSQIDFGGLELLNGHNLYYKGKYVSDLKIPDGTRYISANAFKGGNFNSVTISDTVESIGDSAFENCVDVKSLTIGKKVSSIGASAFMGCTKLDNVVIPGNVKTISSNAFTSCDGLKKLTLNEGITSIDGLAFSGCDKLTGVKIPNSVTTLGGGVFAKCPELAYAVLPNKLETVSSKLFLDCAKLTEITIPASVKDIAADAFDGTGLNKINVTDLNAWMNINFNGHNPLQDAHRLYKDGKPVEKVVLPTVTTIPDGIFHGCTTITSVTIPDSVKVIGDNAFAGCDNIAEVIVKESTWNALNDLTANGNQPLVDGYNKNHVTPPADPEIPLNGPTAPVDEKLVEMMAQILPLKKTAYPAYKDANGNDVYLIGYGTPSKKGATVATEQEARDLMRDYLKRCASVVGTTMGLTEGTQRDAIAAFTYMNGRKWIDNGDPLVAAAKNTTISEVEFLNAIARAKGSRIGAGLNTRLCLGNLFVNGEYSSQVPKNYAHVYLDPNGGVSADLGNVQVYLVDDHSPENLLIDTNLDPHWYNGENTFLGWYTQKKAGDKITSLDASTRGLTLYAHWQNADTTPDGRPANYRIPAYLATGDSRLTENASDRIRVFETPLDPSTRADLDAVKHIGLVNSNDILNVVAEYKTGEGHLWVQLKTGGWVDLGENNTLVIVPGTVKLEAKKRLNVYPTGLDTSTNLPAEPHRPYLGQTIGALRNGDKVTVFERYTDAKGLIWGNTVFYDSDSNIWSSGWVDLTYVTLGDATEDKGEEPGKKVIAKGVVDNTDNVHVRVNPRPDATHLRFLPRGTELDIYDYDSYIGKKWCENQYGWVCMDYVTETTETVPEEKDPNAEDTSGNVGTADNKKILASGYVFNHVDLTVRRGPGNNYPKVDVLQRGARAHIYQTKMYNGVQWGRISEDGKVDPRWACMSYIALDNNAEIKNPEQPAVKLGQGLVYNCSTGVNLRANATPHSAFQGVAPIGTTLQLLEETDKDGIAWYRTPKGWACGLYVKKIDVPVLPPVTPGGEATVPGANAINPTTGTPGIVMGNRDVNVRNLAGVFGHAVVTTLKPGTSVRVYDETSVDGATWYKIDQGWMAAQYIQLGNANNSGSLGTTETVAGGNITGTVLQAGLPILAGPGEGYTSTGKYAYGDVVTVVETKLMGGKAYGRTGRGWVDLKQLSMNGTGITGTGTMATVVNCNHSINVRDAAGGNPISNLRKGSRIEVLETMNLGGTNNWGRTPLGWVSMGYVLPDGPINPPAPPTGPNQPQKPDGEKPKPVDRGIPFDMNGTAKKGATLRIIPGEMGDYDAVLTAETQVTIKKVEKVMDFVWGLTDMGWLNLSTDVTLSTYAVPTNAQLVYQEANTDNAIKALNKNTVVKIAELDVENGNKVWAFVKDSADADIGWIELTNITKLENFSTDFVAKAKTAGVTKVYAETSAESEQIGEDMAAATAVKITKLDKDTVGDLWAHIGTGWVKLTDLDLAHDYTVSGTAMVIWTDTDLKIPAAVKHQNETITVTDLLLNSNNKVVGMVGSNYVDMSCLTAK